MDVEYFRVSRKIAKYDVYNNKQGKRMSRNRQKIILTQLYENKGSYIETATFAKQLNVSKRSIQNDISILKRNGDNNGFNLVSDPRKGTCLIVFDDELINNYLNDPDYDKNLNQQKGRIDVLFNYLINQISPTSQIYLCKLVYISEATLRLDLAKMQDMIRPYSLIISLSQHYVEIQGRETDKRVCLIRWQWIQSETPSDGDFLINSSDEENYFSSVLKSEIQKSTYTVSEIQFFNILALIYISFKRVKEGFYISSTETAGHESFMKEEEIAKRIYHQISDKYRIEIPVEESQFLALYMGSHGTNQNLDYIPEDFQDIIHRCLVQLELIYDIPFADNKALQENLTLHSYPMLIRARNHTPFLNEFSGYVKQNYSRAHDAAVMYAEMFEGRFHCSITENELSLLSVYFNEVILQNEQRFRRKKVAIITTHRHSVRINLQQILMNKFFGSIESIAFLTPEQATDDLLKNYDIVLSTQISFLTDSNRAIYINYYPNDIDLSNIRSALQDNKDQDILSIVHRKNFQYKTYADRDKYFAELDQNFLKNENLNLKDYGLREYQTYTSSWYGDGIVILTPMYSLPKSVLKITLLSSPIEWNNQDEKALLILFNGVCRKDRTYMRQFEMLAQTMFQQGFSLELTNINSYDDFIHLIKKYIAIKLSSYS
jgi:lichenan operon transcriptional antiterminator